MSFTNEDSSLEEDVKKKKVLLLETFNFSREFVVSVRTFEGSSEKELLEWLVKEKPPDLKLGREHYLEEKQLEEYMKGLSLKLNIHGYDDRAQRLKYLYDVLAAKFSNKENVFKIVVQFLMHMAERPTAITNLQVSSVEYSFEPDEEDTNLSNEDSERRKALLKDILFGGDDNDDAPTVSYSSDDSLSEWSENENEDMSVSSNNDLPLGITRPLRTSSSFGEFCDIHPLQDTKPDLEKIRKETEHYWRGEKDKAEECLLVRIRQFQTFPLQSQPVISSRLVLQARFGEFWEWKQLHNRTTTSLAASGLQVVFVEDIVREVLWQFVISRADSSAVFNQDWSVKPTLMVASLSRSTFFRVLTRFGESLRKLEALRKFQTSVLSACHHVTSNLPPSKVLRNYASGLHDISILISERVDKIERELKRFPRPEKDPKRPVCTTFLQLLEQTRDIIQIIDTVYTVHSKSIPQVDGMEEEEKVMPWMSSIKLISCIEFHLVLETRPKLHGVLFFLYSKCLQALLDELLFTLKSLQWDERYSLFVRDKTVLLNDECFWSDCIKIREFSIFNGASISSVSIFPLKCMRKLIPKVLSILKTCEVFDQLQEDFTHILGGAFEISVESLVQEFLEESLSSQFFRITKEPDQLIPFTDFHKHFEALALGSSLASDCFRFLTDNSFVGPTNAEECKFPRQGQRWYTLQDFLQLTVVPTKCYSLLLDAVLSKWFDPFCLSAKRRIEKIFHDYRVLERMTIFQEIILSVREDFARGIIQIASNDYHYSSASGKVQLSSSEYKFEDALARNSKFQRLLNVCYPVDCRGELFSIELKLDRTTDMNCTFDVKPNFPLNLIVTPHSVAGYLFIGRQLHRIRKSLWHTSSLSMKTCWTEGTGIGNIITSDGVNRNRLLIFRFCLINFCSSLRSFFMLKVFSRNVLDYSNSSAAASQSTPVKSFEANDLDYIRKVHENYLDLIQTKMLRHPLIENVLIKKMTVMSETLRKYWMIGLPHEKMLQLEDTLKKCWQVVNDFDSIKYTPDFNQLSWHFGRPPNYLTT